MNIVLTGGTSGLGYRAAQVLGKEIKNKIILIGSNTVSYTHLRAHET